MEKPTAFDIEALCDHWCAIAISKNRGVEIPNDVVKRLLENGFEFHQLNHEALCAALVGFSKVMLLPGLNANVTRDHLALWSWCGELILSPRLQFFPIEQQEIKSLYETTIHAALANCSRLPACKEDLRKQNPAPEIQSHHAKQLLAKSTLVLAYLVFPLLEAVLRRACSAYVNLNGQVISRFSVSGRNGEQIDYDPASRKAKRQCSSLRDMLFLHSKNVASPRLKILIDKFRAHIFSIDNSKDPFDLIFDWRNMSLHGSKNFHTISGTLLNLSLLISLFEIESGFELHSSQCYKHSQLEVQLGYRSPWSFYPPC